MQKVVADLIVYDTRSGTLLGQPATSAANPCQVQMELDENGKIISKGCKAVSCDGTCELKEKDMGEGRIHYWCECK